MVEDQLNKKILNAWVVIIIISVIIHYAFNWPLHSIIAVDMAISIILLWTVIKKTNS